MTDEKPHNQCSAATGHDLPWWKILADNWRGRNGNSTTGDSVRNSCADELEKWAARHHSAVPQPTKEALDLAVNMIIAAEPGDSRAVSDEAVALAAVACGDTSDAVMKVIRAALSLSRPDRGGPPTESG